MKRTMQSIFSPASNLVRSVKESIQSSLNLDIRSGVDVARRLGNPQSGEDVGQVITMSNILGYRLVYIHLFSNVPVQMDSHMIYAFSPKNEHYPHFTVDAAQIVLPGQDEPQFGFHLDLIPRVGIGDQTERLDYYLATYEGLEPVFQSVETLAGASEADLNQIQVSLMSPYMIARRANEDAFPALCKVTSSYLERWLELLHYGYKPGAFRPVPEITLLQYDLKLRKKMFSAEIDPVWDRILPIIGKENRDEMIRLLIDPEPVGPRPFLVV